MPPKTAKADMRKMPVSFSKKHILRRVIGFLWKYYKGLIILALLCLVVSAIAGTTASIFLEQIVDRVIEPGIRQGYDEVKNTLYTLLILMGSVYILGLVSNATYGQVMAVITQGTLDRIRRAMFDKMEGLPIKYFDTHLRGDIMSNYTNDVDTLRQLISQTLPQLFSTTISLSFIFFTMLTFSIWLTLVVILAIVGILYITKVVGGGSAKYFRKQQISLAKEEGFIEEMMNGQKVVKVFTHEEKALQDFDKLNNQLYDDAYKANAYANMLGPMIHNIGNILYVIIAAIGTVFYLNNVPNLSLTGYDVEGLQIGVLLGFMQMGRQFANLFNQISQQVNSFVMALAGAYRVFDLIDQKEEVDEGYVTLVNAEIDKEGNITESKERTGKWAWKHPHNDGSVTYTELKGHIVLDNVDFGYNPDRLVLEDISVYAKPGQKIALVGATGAGKTTITNLITRFYDLADGKVRYDGININKIKKDDLRKSIAMVLQDTSLFTGTVKENIKYGKLDATDEEVYEASKIANAYDFITRLPQGFDTMLDNDGSNLSQGQRQLLSIARAAIANAPVLILDEATSSIDTRTEQLVNQGMDKLMEGRTVFVIAHRLSTIQNANAIMVMDHGKIIERGDHNSLIKEKGYYYQLYTGAFELE